MGVSINYSVGFVEISKLIEVVYLASKVMLEWQEI